MPLSPHEDDTPALFRQPLLTLRFSPLAYCRRHAATLLIYAAAAAIIFAMLRHYYIILDAADYMIRVCRLMLTPRYAVSFRCHALYDAIAALRAYAAAAAFSLFAAADGAIFSADTPPLRYESVAAIIEVYYADLCRRCRLRRYATR